MPSLIRQVCRPASALRALVVASVTLILATACDEQDKLPMGPSIVQPTVPQATVVGATVTVLPNLGGRVTIARDINDAGQVVGWSDDATGLRRAYVWSAAEGIQDIGTLGGTTSEANAINEAGQVVGFSETSPRGLHAFLWTPGRGMQDLGTLPDMASIGRGVNDRGEVVGYAYTQIGNTFPMRAFLWTPAQGMQDLGTLGGSRAGAQGINNAGQVVGSSATASGEEHAFVWTARHGMQDLGTLGSGGSIATGINEIGVIVGSSSRGPEISPVIWLPGQGIRELGTPASPVAGLAWDVNDAGQVVGSVHAGPGGAFVWSLANGMEYLYATTGIAEALAINNRGQVVGSGRVATLRFDGEPNRPPVASVGGPYSGTEGTAIALGLSADDPNGDLLIYTWDLGDGTTGSGTTPPASHVYADNGPFSVRLSVSDGKGGSDMKATTATIANVAPTIPAGGLTAAAAPIPLVAANASAAIAVVFTDPAGSRDTYAAQIQCGNGTTLSPGGIRSPYSGACTYTTAGVYTVRATVADEDGGTSAEALYRYVIVYDPEGGSATGSGFYDVPGQGKGKTKAHFTFNAKFPGQAMAPNGSAKFWIPGGPVDFESTAIQVLVVSGNRVQFWGTGTLNGAAARFRITAIDGGLAGTDGRDDGFRIELWQGGTLVFDTQPGAAQDAPVTTAIDGGNIQIRHD